MRTPQWGPNNDRHFQMLEWYQEALIGGLKDGNKKSIIMNKISEVLQGPEESPSQFYERLCETFRLYTPFDPETVENQQMVNAAFVEQSQGDIRRKLQKLDGFDSDQSLCQL